ncbi:MAG: hypothetical protein HY602_02595 [Parcubacteria group bacterium]|nr:hypothetical protein [Parcubacteria group bacterium]
MTRFFITIFAVSILPFFIRLNTADRIKPIQQQTAAPAFFQFQYPPKPETFIFKLTDPIKIQQTRDILAGRIRDTVHVAGTIIKESMPYNKPWSYHLDPNSIVFFENSMEVCDASIKYVEQHLSEVINWWCPWGSKLIKEIPAPPEITSYPSGPIALKDMITLTGYGFTASGNDINFAGHSKAIPNLSSPDGVTLRFRLPATPCSPDQICAQVVLSPGIYPLSVTNPNGASNTIYLNITDTNL